MPAAKSFAIFINFGHDTADVASAIGTSFATGAGKVASALSAAEVTVEYALEAAWGDGAAELTKDFSMVGNSIAAFGADAEHAIVDVMGDLGGLARDVLSGAGEVLEASVKWFESKVSSCIAS